MRPKTLEELKLSAKHGAQMHADSQRDYMLDMWPAQELCYIIEQPYPIDWVKRWTNCGGRLYSGRMIALKNDPIWSRISKFGLPYAPFDEFDSVDTIGVIREDVVAFGLIAENQVILPVVRNWATDEKQIRL